MLKQVTNAHVSQNWFAVYSREKTDLYDYYQVTYTNTRSRNAFRVSKDRRKRLDQERVLHARSKNVNISNMFMAASNDGHKLEAHNVKENLFFTVTPVTFVRLCIHNLNATVQVPRQDKPSIKKYVRKSKHGVTILDDVSAALLLLERPRSVNTNIQRSSVRGSDGIYVCVEIWHVTRRKTSVGCAHVTSLNRLQFQVLSSRLREWCVFQQWLSVLRPVV
jgi:hypothetical protein